MFELVRRGRERAVTDAAQQLYRGRNAYSSRAWLAAYDAFSRADRLVALQADDLNALATSAYMLGRDEEYVRTLERAYRLHRDADESVAAGRCAFWIGLTLMLRGETGRAGGWLGRALRLVEHAGGECVERGAAGSGGAVLTASINIGTGTK